MAIRTDFNDFLTTSMNLVAQSLKQNGQLFKQTANALNASTDLGELNGACRNIGTLMTDLELLVAAKKEFSKNLKAIRNELQPVQQTLHTQIQSMVSRPADASQPQLGSELHAAFLVSCISVMPATSDKTNALVTEALNVSAASTAAPADGASTAANVEVLDASAVSIAAPASGASTAAVADVLDASAASTATAASEASTVANEGVCESTTARLVFYSDLKEGDTLYIRGDGPEMSWEKGIPCTRHQEGFHYIDLDKGDPQLFQFKLLSNDTAWSKGENFTFSREKYDSEKAYRFFPSFESAI